MLAWGESQNSGCGRKRIPWVLGGSAKEVLLTMFQKKKKMNGLEVDKWRPVFFVVVVPEALMSYCRYAQH